MPSRLPKNWKKKRFELFPEEEIKNVAARVPVRLTPAGLRYLRRRLCLTQLEFAQVLGYSDRYCVRDWESGSNLIPETVQRICELLRLVPKDLRKKFVQKHIFDVM